MPLFAYKARTESGKVVEGVMNLPDKRTVALRLAETGLFASEITRQHETRVQSGLFAQRVRAEDIIIFSQQLATMHRAGLTLIQSLNILISQTENKRLRQILNQVFADVSGGITLANALAKHPKVFSELYSSTVRVGEETGHLDEVLDRLSVYLQRQAELAAKIKSALAYPVVIVCLAVGVIIFVLTFVLPKFSKMFSSAKVELPLPTRIMLGVSDFFLGYWYFVLGGIILAGIAFFVFVRTPQGRFIFDRWQLNFPLIGSIIRKNAILRFTRPLAILTRTGVNILISWEIIRHAVGNVVLAKVLTEVGENIQKGGKMADPLRASNEFPPMVSQMIAVGEETGSLDVMLNALSENYERQIDYSSHRLVVMIEPILLAGIAVVVAFLALAVYLPIFSMMKVMGG